MNNTDAELYLISSNALIRDDHFVFRSGRHSDTYLNKDAFYLNPFILEALCQDIADNFAKTEVPIEVVLGPALGGILISNGTAYSLSENKEKPVLAAFAEKNGRGEFIIKRGYDKIISKKNILVVEDILTTGASAIKVIELAKKHGANVVGVGVICNRGNVTKEMLGVPKLFSVMKLELESWKAEDCPLCKKGIPINKELGKGKELT